MEREFDSILSEDYDDDGELNVEHYPIPKGLQRAWDALAANEELEKGLNATVATALTFSGDTSPGPGVGANYVVDTPVKKPSRKPVKKDEEDDPSGVKRAIREPKPRATNVIKTEKEVYTGFTGVHATHKYVIPEGLRAPVPSEEIQANREHVQKQFRGKKNAGNRVDIKRGWKTE